jgi:PTS system mannose-specific IID component
VSAPSAVRLPRRVRWHVFARSFLLQAGFNPRAMQGLGFAYAMYPALKALYEGEARQAAVRRHLEHFNTHPYFAAAVLGGTLRLEEQVAAGEAPPDTVVDFRKALGPPLAAIGDAFFWNALRPACALLAALTAPTLGLGAIAVFLALYNVVHLSVRVWLFRVGYREAEGLVAKVGRAQFPVGTVFLRRAAAALAGAVAAQIALVAGRQTGARGFVAAGAAALLSVILADRLPAPTLAYVALALSLLAGLLF